MMLNIGCGRSRKKGAIGLDIRKTSSVDILADARMLPFRNESFSHVYSSHLIEHFGHREVSAVLNEWIRVLRRNGIIEIRCPDLRARALLFFLSPSWNNVKNIYGAQGDLGNYHKCGFSFQILKALLEAYGIRDIKRVIKGYKGIPFVPDCLHIKGVKR